MSIRRLRPGRRFAKVSLGSVVAFTAYATSDLWAPKVAERAQAFNNGVQGRLQERRERRNGLHEVA